jgi:hypothetical protein
MSDVTVCTHITLGASILFFFYSFIYLHSMVSYMARKPGDIEILNDNETSDIIYINTN